MDLCVGKIKGFSGRGNNGWIRAKPPPGALGHNLLHGTFDAAQNHLAGGTTLLGGRAAQTAMQGNRYVQVSREVRTVSFPTK